MKPDELRGILEAAGRQDAPPRSVKDLPDLDPTVLHRTRSGAARVLAVAAAVVVLVAGLVVMATRGDDTTDVATEPVTSSTTTMAPPTTVAPPVTTTTAPPVTTTAAAEPPTTTTTTTVPAEEALTLTCVTSQDPQPAVTCEWRASTRAGLDHYRLWKHTGDGPDQEVYAGTDTRAVDTAVLVGARLVYEVTALAADGTVLGHGTTTITCC